LQTQRYGAMFLRSVPECTLVRGSTQDLPGTVARWLDRSLAEHSAWTKGG
jgi:hypothetical protein